ncbi:uncharacterized protein KY384_000737 [Bacidia gigantensis]|uniref:uncharacterized protein n=1 Tax=Bacidia gigantensis TaxID=2732470 RepID=UPI001D0577EC|nr:uncharacterized protein KY384_000737 [Bacidia gigantensis]KAG8525975.1 hypothetical protein KY384_000737 [Bacidia gigantensis]
MSDSQPDVSDLTYDPNAVPWRPPLPQRQLDQFSRNHPPDNRPLLERVQDNSYELWYLEQHPHMQVHINRLRNEHDPQRRVERELAFEQQRSKDLQNFFEAGVAELECLRQLEEEQTAYQRQQLRKEARLNVQMAELESLPHPPRRSQSIGNYHSRESPMGENGSTRHRASSGHASQRGSDMDGIGGGDHRALSRHGSCSTSRVQGPTDPQQIADLLDHFRPLGGFWNTR